MVIMMNEICILLNKYDSKFIISIFMSTYGWPQQNVQISNNKFSVLCIYVIFQIIDRN